MPKTKAAQATVIVVDGNDGTGKSTLVAALKELGFKVKDRGLPTKLTDYPQTPMEKAEEVYLILDLPVSTCQKRLLEAGKDLTEQYHTKEDLTHYRQRFLSVAKSLQRCKVLDASGSKKQTLKRALAAMEQLLANE